MAEFVYQMYKARKAVGDKVILDDVTVGVYPGAKIGVVGPNGMGKSTLLKVMAGLEEVSNGEAMLTPGYTVGLLQQEPPLEEDKTVKENIELAFADVLAKVARFNEIGELMADPDADFDALMDEMGRLQDEIDAANGWDLDSQLSQAMDALQCPDPDMPVNVLSGGERRRVALCSRRPTCSFSTSPPTIWTPSRCSGSSSSCIATREPSWPSRTTATSSTTWPDGSARSTAGSSTPTRATTPPTSRRRPRA